jgi:hypothetical protein
MALKLIEQGYGQLELNLVSFPRTGNIVAQYRAGKTFTEAKGEAKYLENGMLLAVDGKNRCVEKAAPVPGMIYALNYSTEHMYDERTYRLADFKLNPTDDFYPRLGYLSIGDKFTTNCVCYETAQKVAEAWAALKEAFVENEIIGVPSAEGYIELKVVSEEDSTMPEAGSVLRVIEFTTMPDGQNAVKFEVVRA